MYACLHSTRLGEGKEQSALLLECARGFAPTAELADSETVVFSITGLGLLYGPLETIARVIVDRVSRAGVEANIAIAHNADAAILIASCRPGLEIVRPVETEDRLSSLDIRLLPLSPGVEETLLLWGVRTMGEFARLPEIGVVERLGPEAVRWQNLARGATDRPLIEVGPDDTFVESLELEYPIALLDALVFAIGRILTSLCTRLVMSGLAADELTFSLELEDGTEYQETVRLPLPLDSSKPLLRIIRNELEKSSPQAAICGIVISVRTVIPRRLQFGLFLPATPEPAKLEMTLSRLRAMVGENNVGIPELIDSHHPRPFRLVPFSTPQTDDTPRIQATTFVLSMRNYHPPIESALVIEGSRPVKLVAGEMTRKVINAAGPWRLSGDWWNSTDWEREEWDLGLGDGTVCRVARVEGRWLLEGVYD
ncbi:MAG: DNA polymerase Y family protein [Acidobacteriota bacterium]